MRHGKPTYTGFPKVTSAEMIDWIAQYDLSDTGSDTPPGASKLLASSASKIVSSPLPRAISSLKALGRDPDIIDGVFREAELPVSRIPALRLSPLNWAIFFRIMWLCGLSRKVERFRMAKKRAVKAADLLNSLAKNANGPVLLLGHGIMNRLIAKELIASGWKEHCHPGKEYWSAGIYKFL
ncbi:broad specificity phosphatase PhoE [Enterobacter sp. BIGb0383]|nr:broad specificity phosphatase PhoE [Enterobacter sp. BIGb0383]ROS11910.1 broad specificity phosphatase PhoE [Enterobacter sp. BIGb0359]